jgi:hypothetical protein
MTAQWTAYQAGVWAARYRILNHLLEVELETVSRTAPGSFILDVDQHLPPEFELGVEQEIEVSVKDDYLGERIFMGGRVPGHWKRVVSLVVPVYPSGVSPYYA